MLHVRTVWEWRIGSGFSFFTTNCYSYTCTSTCIHVCGICMYMYMYMYMYMHVHVYAIHTLHYDIRKVGKYFFITTFDAEPRTTSVKHHSSCETSGRISTSTLQAVSTCPDTSASDKANEGNVLHDHSDSGHVISGNYGNQHHSNESLDHHGDVHVHAPHSAVERYVHISTSSLFKHFPGSTRIKLKAKSAVRPDFARFQLIDRRDRKAKTLLESDWLPDERESQGQPFFLRQYYHLSKCIGITGFAESQATRSDYRFNLSKKSSHCEGRCHMLFQLVRAEKMTDSNAGNLD